MFLRLLLILTFSIALPSQSLMGQWEILADSVFLMNGYRMRAVKITNDKTIWISAVPGTLEDSDDIHRIFIYRAPAYGSHWSHWAISGSYGAGDISALDSLTAIASCGSEGLFKTVNGGHEWLHISSYPYESVLVHFFNENDGWVLSGPRIMLGGNQRNIPIIHSVTTDGGISWNHIGGEEWSTPFGSSLPEMDSSESLGGINFTNSKYDVRGDVIVVGMTMGNYWISYDKGYNWQRCSTPLTDLGIDIDCISIKDENTIIAAGLVPKAIRYGGELQDGGCIVVATNDGGASWTQAKPSIFPSSLEFIPGTEETFVLSGFISLFPKSYGTAITYNSGRTWKYIDDKRIGLVDFLDENTGIAPWFMDFRGTTGPIYNWNSKKKSLPTLLSQWFLVAIVSVFSGIIIIFVYREYRKRMSSGFSSQFSSLKQAAINAEMNNDFVFNSLQAIEDMINTGNKSLANDYLVDFAALTRGVLQASREALVPFEDDLSLLKTYLSLEKLRLGELIEYQIEVDEKIDVYDTMVPAMVVQSVVENCINNTQPNDLQSLMIQISYFIQDDNLMINIDDNLQSANETGQSGVDTSGTGFIVKQLKDIQKKSEMKVFPLVSDKGRIYGTRTHIALNLV